MPGACQLQVHPVAGDHRAGRGGGYEAGPGPQRPPVGEDPDPGDPGAAEETAALVPGDLAAGGRQPGEHLGLRAADGPALAGRGPRSLEVCAFLIKPERRKVDLRTRYVGFEIPNRFAIGYGLDYRERYRNLPFVAALKE